MLDKSWNEDAGHFRRDRGAEQKAYQADTPLWSNEEHGEKDQVLVSRLVQHDTSVVRHVDWRFRVFLALRWRV